MKKKINACRYDYVDLELPSGTLWATCNVGALSPEESGLYFQFGDTHGYAKEQVGKDKQFGWSDYNCRWKNIFDHTTNNNSILKLKSDAAHINMGGSWHMPTPEQIKELTANTISTWTMSDEVDGRLFTSKKDSSKSIFIPAAGMALGGSVQNSGIYGFVWASMLNMNEIDYGQDLRFNPFSAHLSNHIRFAGFSVRGVIDKKDNISNRKKNNTEMNKNLNLVDILKDAPKGTKLWSPICGDCILDKIETTDTTINYAIHCLTVNDHTPVQFAANGKYTLCFDDGECVLFPSKENHDWSTFKVPKAHKKFEPYQKVLVKVYGKSDWDAGLYNHYDALTNRHYLIGGDWVKDEYIIPYEGNKDKLGKPVE